MKRKKVVLLNVLFACALAGALQAEQKAPLTNRDIATMLRAGVPESNILTAIEQKPGAYDDSTQGLVDLRKAKASEAVLAAIQKKLAGGVAAAAVGVTETDTRIAGLPREAGVFFRDGAGWQQLELAPVPKLKSKGIGSWVKYAATYGIAGGRVANAWPGAHARVQVPAPKPVFYCRDVPGCGGAQVAQLMVKDQERRLEIGGASLASGIGSGIQDKHRRAITIERLSPSVISVTPVEHLSAGEYLLALPGTTSGQLTTDYDFGVEAGE